MYVYAHKLSKNKKGAEKVSENSLSLYFKELEKQTKEIINIKIPRTNERSSKIYIERWYMNQIKFLSNKGKESQ